MGLYEFLVAARDRCFTSELVDSLLREEVREVRRVADTVLRLAEQGNFNLARKLAHIYQDHADLIKEKLVELDENEPWNYGFAHYPELYDRLDLAVYPDPLTLADSPGWRRLAEACDLADRIDSFLAALRGDKVQTALVKDCCCDLNTLLMLADWCEEHNLPMAAAEARYLHHLIRL